LLQIKQCQTDKLQFFSEFTGLLGVKKLLLGKKNECAFSAARLK